MVHKWRNEKIVNNLDLPINLGKTNINVDWLAFVDDLVNLTLDITTAQK